MRLLAPMILVGLTALSVLIKIKWDTPVSRATCAQVSVPNDLIREFCLKNCIQRLSFFGSVLRGDFRPDSDIDIIVEFMPGKTAGLLAMARMQRELSELFGGRSVDLRTPEELSRYFRDEVMKNAETCYVA